MFKIASVDVSKFEVSGRFLGRQIEKVELVFQVRGSSKGSTNMILCYVEYMHSLSYTS